jgi:hypothetical protein
MNFEPGRFALKPNDPRFSQSWLTAPTLVSLDDGSESRQPPQWPLWTLRWLSLIMLIKSVTDVFSALMPTVNVRVVLSSASDVLMHRAFVALFNFDFGLLSLVAACITLCGCGARSRGALSAVQVLVALELLLAIGRAIYCSILISEASKTAGGADDDPTWLTLVHRFITLLLALSVFGAVFVVTRTAKIAARSSTGRNFTKLDDFR